MWYGKTQRPTPKSVEFQRNWNNIWWGKKYFLLGWLEQPRQDKNLLYRHDKPYEPTKEGPLSFVLFESPLPQFQQSAGPQLSSFSGLECLFMCYSGGSGTLWGSDSLIVPYINQLSLKIGKNKCHFGVRTMIHWRNFSMRITTVCTKTGVEEPCQWGGGGAWVGTFIKIYIW